MNNLRESHYYNAFLVNNPIGKFLLWSSSLIIGLLVCLVLYTIIFEIDIATTATGKVVPEGKIKTVQAVIGGKVAKILVQEGSLVKENEPLILLDTTQYQHDLNVATEKFNLISKKLPRLKNLIEILTRKDEITNLSDEKDFGFINEIFSLKKEMQETQDSLENNMTELVKSEENISHIKYKINNATKLASKVIPRERLVDLNNQLQNLLAENKIKKRNIETLKDRSAKIKSDALFKAHYALEQLETEKNLAYELIKKLKYDINNMQINSPIIGHVENLKLCTIGGMVASGEAVMNIVPIQTKEKLEVNLHSKDIGFVKIDQLVAIKFDAFPYTQYGTLKGKICKISSDSFSSDNINFYYKTDICLDKNYLNVKGGQQKIKFGYTAQVDIYTDKRRIISFFIDPIKTAIDNSFKEQ